MEMCVDGSTQVVLLLGPSYLGAGPGWGKDVCIVVERGRGARLSLTTSILLSCMYSTVILYEILAIITSLSPLPLMLYTDVLTRRKRGCHSLLTRHAGLFGRAAVEYTCSRKERYCTLVRRYRYEDTGTQRYEVRESNRNMKQARGSDSS